MENVLKEMHTKAMAVMQHAYCAYSNLSVGACLRTANNKLFAGCNIENASFSITQCAEGVAVGAMISSGESVIEEILVVSNSPVLCPPCGACRQMIAEFAGLDVKVHLANETEVVKTYKMTDLLPDSFGPSQLK